MHIKTALYLKAKHLGDTVILTSAIESLPEGWKVDVLCFRHSVDILSMNHRVNKIYVIPRGEKGLKKYFEYFKIYAQIISSKYELVVQFSDDWRGAIFSRICRAKKSIAYATYRRPKIWHNSFKTILVRKQEKHVAELEVDLIRAVGLYRGEVAPRYCLEPRAEAADYVDSRLVKQSIYSDKLIVINPTSRWTFKEIKSQTWVELIDALHLDGWQVILLGGAQDFESNQIIAQSCFSTPHIISDFTIEQSSVLLKKAQLLVSIDSFAIHLASAMGCKVVAIFGPTNEVNWHPWQCDYLCVTQDEKFSCRPCGWAGCQGTKISECLKTVTSQMLMNACQRLLVTKL